MTAKYGLMIGYRGLKIEVLYVGVLRYGRIENCTSYIHNWKELLEGRLGFDSPSHPIGRTGRLDERFQSSKLSKKHFTF